MQMVIKTIQNTIKYVTSIAIEFGSYFQLIPGLQKRELL